MLNRILSDYTITDETRFLIGECEIVGNVTIQNGQLIVFGSLNILGNLVAKNSEIIVSDCLHILRPCEKMSVVTTDVSVGSLVLGEFPLDSIPTFCLEDSDLFVADSLNSECEISSNGDITVQKCLETTADISCLNLLANFSVDCVNISATLDIYCGGELTCVNLHARDIFVDKQLSCGEVFASRSIYAGDFSMCSFLSVGK